MASGTQSYSSTSGSLIDPAKRVRDKVKDKSKDEKVEGFKRKLITIFDTYTSDIEATAGMFTGVSNSLLEPGGNALPSADDISPDSPQDGVIKALTGISDDIKAQNQILVLQTKMLAASMELQNKLNADTKRLRREERAEKTEDLSGTQGVVKSVANAAGGGGGLIGGIADTLQIVQALAGLNRIKNIGRMFKGFKMPNFSRAANAADVTSDVAKVIPKTPLLQANNLDSFKPSGVTTSLGVGGGKNIDAIEATVDAIPSSSSVNEIINNATNTTKVANNTTDTARTINNATDTVTSTNKIVDTVDVIGDTSKTTSALTKVDDVVPKGVLGKGMDMLGAIPGAKFILPGASGVSGVMNMASGNFAEGALDLADASVDTAIATGVVSQTGTIASTMGPAIAVTGAGLLSGYIGEITRGTDEWIRGDGKNSAMNAVADTTAGLSATLETVGAPFTALFSGVDSLIKTGGFEESNKKMAEVDTNIREGLRKFTNMFDFMDVVSDDVGGLGTLGLYGEENQKNAKQQLLKDKGIVNEGDTNTTNIESTAKAIEKTTDIESSIINTVLSGGTSGNDTLDQKIFNEYKMMDLKERIADLPEGESKELDSLYAELKGLESGEIKAERPTITTDASVTSGDTTTVTNDSNVSSGDTTTSSVTGDSSNITKPETTISSVMNNNVKDDPGSNVIVIQQPIQTAKTESNEQKTNDVSFQIGLTDTNADAFKDLTLLSALS